MPIAPQTFPIDRLNPHFPAANIRTPTQIISQPCVGPDGRLTAPHLTGDATRDFPWLYPPISAQDFTYAGVIDLPAVGVTATMLTFQAPTGWDGIVRIISHEVIGGGFNQGSGDLVFRILRNGQPVPNYGQMLLTYGTADNPRDLAFGIPVAANSIIQYTVTNVALGGAGIRVAATAAGWWWKIAKEYDR